MALQYSLVCIAVVLGHMFSPWIRFKGGKGVATGFGSVILHLPIIIVVLIPSLPIIYISKYVSLGSVIGSFLSIILILYLVLTNNISSDYLYIGLIIPSIILFKHYQNIKRLINKTESKISFTNGSK